MVAGAALGRGRFAVRVVRALLPRLARERAGQGRGGQRHPFCGIRPEGLRETAEGVEFGLLRGSQLHLGGVEFVLGEGVRDIQGEGVEQVLVAVLAQRPGEAVASGADGLGGDLRVAGGSLEPAGEVGTEQVGQATAVLGRGEQRVEERGSVVRHLVHLTHRGAVRRGEGAGGGVGSVGDPVRLRRLGAPCRLGVLLRPVRYGDRGRTLVVGGEAGGGEVQPVMVRGGGVEALLPAADLVAGGLPGVDGL
ncbi:hypothetical protein GCM10010518_19750 [Kitasatospora cinereorecta]